MTIELFFDVYCKDRNISKVKDTSHKRSYRCIKNNHIQYNFQIIHNIKDIQK